jgi:tetratricopeptide (TPR) repeat protein
MKQSRKQSSTSHTRVKTAPSGRAWGLSSTHSILNSILLWQSLALVVLAFVVYGRTISYGFINDDRMVITQNTIVKQGLKGIPELLTKDSFYGFDAELRRTGQRKTYRPLSFIMFAVEWQIAPNNPTIGHFVQVTLYGALGVLLMFMLRAMLPLRIQAMPHQTSTFVKNWLPFTAAALFVLHPIHTEVVCNIKSRDELLALVCLASSVLLLLRYVDTSIEEESSQVASRLALAASVLMFVLALLSKESAVTFLPVVPTVLWCCRSLPLRQIAILSTPFVASSAIYLAVWFGIVGRVEEAVYVLPLTNPFVHATLAERTATATWVMLMYLGKALYPVTLSQGYTYNEIPLMTWMHWKPLCALIVFAVLIAFAVWKLRERHLLSLCVVWFVSTMAIASNLFVYAGGFLGERFLFTPSLAAVLALVWLVFTGRFFVERRVVAISICAVCGILYANRTVSRAAEWSSEASIAAADVAGTPNSYIVRLSAAKSQLTTALAENDLIARSAALRTAIDHLNAARTIDSVNDPQLYTMLGLCYAENGEFDKAISAGKRGFEGTQTALLYRNSTGFICYTAKCYAQTLIKTTRESAIAENSTQMTPQKRALLGTAIAALQVAVQRDTPVVDVDVEMTLANCYDALDRYDSAMVFAERALTRVNATATHRTNAGIIASNWGGSLMEQGRTAEAVAAYARALPFDDANPRLHWSIGNAHFARGMYDSAAMAFRRAVALDPRATKLREDLAKAEAMLSAGKR